MLRYNVEALKDEGVSTAFNDSVYKTLEGDVSPNSTVDDTWLHFIRAIRVAAMTQLIPLISLKSQHC